MIVFAAITPHSPLLIPTVGKEHREKLADTLAAYAQLEQALVTSQAETLVVISPHGQMYPDAFSGNVSDTFTGVLKEFGDHGTALTAKVDFLVLDHIHRAMRQESIPFTLTSQEELDYGYTVPLLLLTSKLPAWRLVPISTSLLDLRQHYEFGRQLKRVLHAENRRIAVLASADLSHHVNQNSPQGMLPEGQQFDALVREKLAAFDAAPLLTLDPAFAERAGSCGLKPMVTLLGALENMNVTFREWCYEAPFGVGYLTGQFELA